MTSVSDPARTYFPERYVVGRLEFCTSNRRETTLELGSRFAPEMNIRAPRRLLCDSLGLFQVLVEG